MKKYLCIAALLAVSLSLGACGETGESTTAETTTGAAETTTTTAATEETTTTTTEVTTTTEATTTEEPEIGITPMPDSPDGMYPMSECFRRVVEEYTGSKVLNIEFDDELHNYVATTENDEKYLLYLSNKEREELYETNEPILVDLLGTSVFVECSDSQTEAGITDIFILYATPELKEQQQRLPK